MVQVTSADLAGKLHPFGQLEFLRVEWWSESPRIVLLRYALNGREEPRGIRLDIDKKAVLDSVSNAFLDDAIRKNAADIWEVAIRERENALRG